MANSFWNSSSPENGTFFKVHLFPEDVKGTSNQNLQFEVQGLWMVVWLCVLEYIILWITEKPLPPPHENLMSISHGILYNFSKIFTRSFEYGAYVWLWENHSFFPNLFSNSFLSFATTILLIDLGYYWFHRLSHEVSVFWAFHQVHHTSADLTVTVGLRHSPIQTLFSWVFYLPLALVGLPPSHLAVHLQLNLLYQTWIHTEAIDNLGPLEWIFNTPSHHRVHHGSIKYCIDKNYGGVFIFWDYLFGTFELEKPEEEILYGIIIQPQKWNIAFHQAFYIEWVIQKANSMTNWLDYVHTFWKGPSWIPGSSRTGRELDVAYATVPRPREVANCSIPIDTYVGLHLLGALLLLSNLANAIGLSVYAFSLYSLLVLAALTNVGIIYEGRAIAAKIEFCRCLLGIILSWSLPITSSGVQYFLLALFITSFGMWCLPTKLHETKFGLTDKPEEEKVEHLKDN